MYTRKDIKIISDFLEPAAKTGLISDLDAVVSTLEIGLNPAQAATAAPEVWMSMDDVMKFYNIKRSTFYSWIKRGWLTPYGRGRKTRFRASEVQTIREEQ